jgi:hypothetical protein
MGGPLYLLTILLLTCFRVVQGIPQEEPAQITSESPKPTDAPNGPLQADLLRRDTTVPPNVCGWIDGDPNCKQRSYIPSLYTTFFGELNIESL